MIKISHRVTDSQKINCQYPCTATNIGDNRICIHINIASRLQQKALVLDFSTIQQDITKIEESGAFIGFVDYTNFEDIGVQTRNIQVNAAAKFVYLSKSKVLTKKH